MKTSLQGTWNNGVLSIICFFFFFCFYKDKEGNRVETDRWGQYACLVYYGVSDEPQSSRVASV